MCSVILGNEPSYSEAMSLSYTHAPDTHTHSRACTKVTTVILSDRLRSSLLCHDVILVDPLLSCHTTAVVKPVTMCDHMNICECVKERM